MSVSSHIRAWGVIVDQTLIREQTVAAGGGTLRFGLSEPLRAGAVVGVRVNGSDNVNAGAVPALIAEVADKSGAGSNAACQPEAETDDESPYKTFGENRTNVIKLKPLQVNLLADLAAWSITNTPAVEEIVKTFGADVVPMPKTTR
jgi:hypothetical protein